MEDAAIQRGSGVRTAQPSPRDLSSQGWVGERAAEILPGAAERLWRGSLAHEPIVLFLGGSAIHGELCGIEDPSGRRWFLSDLDLGIVTAHRIPADRQLGISEDLARVEGDSPGLRAGFYCWSDLGRQHPTLGLVETVRQGFVLRGDAGALAGFRMPEPTAIPRWESRRLLCNRVLELLAAADPARAPLDRVYALSKLLADCAAVLLLHGRCYTGGGFAGRLASIRGADLPDSLGKRITAWTGWRLEPRWGRTPLGCSVDGAETALILGEAGSGLKGITELLAPGPQPARGFLTPADVRGRAWARAWKRWRRLAPASSLRFGWDVLTRTPRVLLWEAALRLVLGDETGSAGITARLLGEPAESFEATRASVVQSSRLMEHGGVE